MSTIYLLSIFDIDNEKYYEMGNAFYISKFPM